MNNFKTNHLLADADWLALGDINHDNAVTTADIQAFLNALANPGSTLQGVPEPATLVLVIVGLLCSGGVARRRHHLREIICDAAQTACSAVRNRRR
jgi:hypothetical protein